MGRLEASHIPHLPARLAPPVRGRVRLHARRPDLCRL